MNKMDYSDSDIVTYRLELSDACFLPRDAMHGPVLSKRMNKSS